MKAELDRDGRSPLHYAALENDAGATRVRLAAGDDPKLGDRRGFTPLHFAAQQHAVDVDRLLLDAGADVDQANSYGNTPLWVAVFNAEGRGEMITLLRERGADPFKVNKAGKTPLDVARSVANYDLAQYFADLPDPRR